MMRRGVRSGRPAAFAAVAILMTAIGCSASGPAPGVTLAQGVAQSAVGAEVRLSTGLVLRDGKTMLCDSWLDSMPPACPPALSATLTNVRLTDLALQEVRGVRFGSVDIVVRRGAGKTFEYVGLPR